MATSIGCSNALLCCFKRRGAYEVTVNDIPDVGAPQDSNPTATLTRYSVLGTENIDAERLCMAVCRDKVRYLEENVPDPHVLREYRLYISDTHPTHIMTLALICASPNILKFLLQRSRCNPNETDPLFSTPLEVLLLSWDCRPEELPLMLCNTRHQWRLQGQLNSVSTFHQRFIPSDRPWRRWLSNRHRCLRLLCKAGAEVMKPFEYLPLLPLEYSVTMTSSTNGLAVAGVLIDHGADINRGTRHTLPPLIRAIDRGNRYMVRYLLECGALIECNDPAFYNGVLSSFNLPGFRRIFFHDNGVDILKLLISSGGNPNSIDPHTGQSAILCAAMDCRGSLCANMIKYLLQNGAEATINTPDMYGYTPLLAACQRRDITAISLLLDHGARTNVTLDGGRSPLYLFLNDIYILLKDIPKTINSRYPCLEVDAFNNVLNRLLCIDQGLRLVDAKGRLPMLLMTVKYKDEGLALIKLCRIVPSLQLMSRNVIVRLIQKEILSENNLAKLLPNCLQKFVLQPLVIFAPCS